MASIRRYNLIEMFEFRVSFVFEKEVQDRRFTLIKIKRNKRIHVHVYHPAHGQ